MAYGAINSNPMEDDSDTASKDDQINGIKHLGFDLVMTYNLPGQRYCLLVGAMVLTAFASLRMNVAFGSWPQCADPEKSAPVWIARCTSYDTWSSAAPINSKMPAKSRPATTRPLSFLGSSTSRRPVSGGAICQHESGRSPQGC